MVDPGTPIPPRLLAEALGTIVILTKLAAILAAHFQTFCEDVTALSAEKRSGRGIHYFLAHLTLGFDPVLGLERVTLVGVDPYGMVHFMQLLFSVLVDIYSPS